MLSISGAVTELWTHYDLPKKEGTRIHHVGSTKVCVSVEAAGDGDLLAAMALYDDPSHAARGRRQRADHALVLPPIDASVWFRYNLGRSTSYRLLPGYPPIPTCVTLKEPFSLLPGADLSGWIFSRIEALVEVDGTTVVSLPLCRPFKTLYGTPQTGVVCRYDEAIFLAEGEPMTSSLHDDPGLVAHPVRLRNSSNSPVLVENLCLYGEQLSIFGIGARMYSEKVVFNFNSSGVRMNVDGSGRVPTGVHADGDVEALARPRVTGEELALERSIELIRAMTRM